MHSASLTLRASIIAILLLVLAAFWVPIDFNIGGHAYYYADIFSKPAPRALLGTIIRILHLEPHTGYILFRQLSQTLWLILIVFQITKSLSPNQDVNNYSTLAEVVALSFLFAFSTVVFTTNGSAEFIDVVPYTLTLCAVPLLLPSDNRVTIIRAVAATLLLLAAVMVHEKSIFDLAILTVWTTWKLGFKRSATLMLPSIVGSLCFLWLVSGGRTQGLSPLDSIKLLRSGLTFLFTESLNVWGIILAGGMLWVIFIVAAYQFLKTRTSYSLQGFIVIAMLISICFATLLIAHDTIRMVGLIWLPTYLLIREIDLKSALESIRFRKWAFAACMLQLLLPPILLYQNGVGPFNCYSRELISRFLPHKKDIATVTMSAHDGFIPAVGPFGLYALDHKELFDAIVCWPPRPIRDAWQVFR